MNFPLILKVIHLSLNTQFKLVGVLWHTGFMWDKEEDNIPFAFDWILHLLERYSRLLLGLKTAHLCFCHKPKRQTTEEEVRPTVIFCFPPSLPPSSWDSLEIKGKQKVLFCSFFFMLAICCWIIGHHLRPTSHPNLLYLRSFCLLKLIQHRLSLLHWSESSVLFP